MSVLYWAIGLVAAERLAELAHAARNTRRLLARGGVEQGRGHYPLLVLLHAAWLGAMVAVIPADAPADPLLLAVFGVLQAVRLWVIASLGEYWTTRIVTIQGEPLVRRGPYRWLRHPNYAVVIAEIAILPAAFAAFELAVVFSGLNLAIVAHRIRIEDAALAPRRSREI